MAEAIALGVDVGSTHTKASLVAVSGHTVRELAIASSPTPSDAGALLTAVHNLVRQLTERGTKRVDVVGVASMAESGVPLDDADVALCDILRWDGERGEREAELLASQLGKDELFSATGVRPSAKVPLVTWRWLQESRPQVWRAMRRWVGMADLVCLAMTGQLATDHTLAGRTMAYRLPELGAPLPEGFDPDLLAAVGMDASELPAVVAPGVVAGVVTAAASMASGLRRGTPVVIAGHDHPVAAWAAGLRHGGQVADSVGTAESVMTLLADEGPALDRRDVAMGGMSLVRAVDGQHEALVAGTPTAGKLVRWWLDQVAGQHDIDAVLRGVTALPAEPTGVIFLPFPNGRQSPAPDPSARLRIHDNGADVTVAQAIRTDAVRFTHAMFEGVSLQARWMQSAQRQLAQQPTPAEILLLVGGGARTGPWMAVKRAVTPQRLSMVSAEEPVATGAALLAAHRLGLVDAAEVMLPRQSANRPGLTGRQGGAIGDPYRLIFESYLWLAGDSAGAAVRSP